MGDLEQRKLELVGQAIGDIQGSIHANDSKSAAGLVVHGLLATGVLSLVGNLGSVYHDASDFGRLCIQLSLACALALAVTSIVFFCLAIRPYEPKHVNERNLTRRYKGLFFPDVPALTRAYHQNRTSELEQLRDRLDTLADYKNVETEYLGELAAVAEIRFTEAKWAKRGFNLLAFEIGAVAVFLVVVGISAA